MPELPEVETIRLGLEELILGKTITGVSVRKEKIVRGDSKQFKNVLKGNAFEAIDRRGKLLIVTLSKGNLFLLIHLKMTGQLIYVDGEHIIAGGHSWPTIEDSLPNKYSHIIINFADKSTLFFNDMRQFGYMNLVSPEALEDILFAYGPEPLLKSFTLEVFEAALKKRTISIKAALLNQSVIAGIGNIYADEALFKAGVRPIRSAGRLTKAERKKLYLAIVAILKKAVKYGGTTFHHYRDAKGGKGNFTRLLKVYGRGGKICLNCKATTLRKIKVAGRGTVYCPTCQK